MLYESGYITVKDYDSIGRYFWFDYPNAEVRGRFSTLVANDYYGKDVEFVSWAQEINRIVYDGRIDDQKDAFVGFFADVRKSSFLSPGNIVSKKYWYLELSGQK